LFGRIDGNSDDDTFVFEDDYLTWAAIAQASRQMILVITLDVKHPKEALLSKALLPQNVKGKLLHLLLDLGDGFFN